MNPPMLPKKVQKGRFPIWFGAFFFAVTLWTFVISEHRYNYVIEMPIEVRNIREGKTLGGEVSPTAEVRFNATGRAFLKTLLLKSISDFKLVLDLERVSTEYNFYLNDYFDRYSQKVVVPAGFELDFVEVVQPDSIHISLDDYMIKPVSVESSVIVKPLAGFIMIGKANIYPKIIELKGPREIIRNVNELETIEKTFNSVESSIKARIDLKFDFPRVVESSDTSVIFEAKIESIGERIISEVPVNILNIPEGIISFANPSTVSLTVSGGVDFIASLEPNDIYVSIDFNELNEGNLSHEPLVVVPDDVLQWSDLSPKTVELTIRRLPE
mgnify:CR=1 FL=1|tara:strand:+ start:15417 stop:16397 length:981 start_codon:yes stop_codon:yes gene_type:complete